MEENDCHTVVLLGLKNRKILIGEDKKKKKNSLTTAY